MLAGLKTQSLKGVLWSACESVGVAVLSFASFLVMARSLEPRDFGVAALGGVFVFFCNLILGHCLADAIVQRRDRDPVDFDTAFWGTMLLGLVLGGACFALADEAAWWLDEPMLTPVLRWLSLCLPVGAVSAVPVALSRGDMAFAGVAKCNLAGRAAGAVLGVALALGGAGVWSLVAQQIATTVLSSCAVLILVPWRPRLRFSFASARNLASFGFHVSASYIVSGAGEQALNLIIGGLFGTAALGYFAVAMRIMQLVRYLVSSAVYYVGLSAFSRLSHDRAALARAFLQSMRISTLIGVPIGVGMAAVSGPLIVLLSGPRWVASGPILAVMALEMIPIFYGMFHAALYRATDHGAWTLGAALASSGLGIAGAYLLAPFGVIAITGFLVVRTVILMPVHILLARRVLPVSVGELIAPLLVPAAAAFGMLAVIVPARSLLDPARWGAAGELALLATLGALTYAGVSWLLSPALVATIARMTREMLRPAREAR